MGKVYTRFQTKTAQKPYPIPDVVAHTYAAYIREYLPPIPPSQPGAKETCLAINWILWVTFFKDLFFASVANVYLGTRQAKAKEGMTSR